MLDIRLFPKIIVCLLNSHLSKDANIYNYIVLLCGRLVFIPKIIFIAPVIAEISVRFPSLSGVNTKHCHTPTPLQKLEEKRTFLFIAWSDQGCARLIFFGVTRVRLMWHSSWFNSDSTELSTFLDWLNFDSTQIPNLLTWLNSDSTHMSQSWYSFATKTSA